MTTGGPASWFYQPDWSVLRVKGPDAASFLHNMCTNDIKGLDAGVACEALFTDVKAHAIAHALVIGGDDVYDVVVTSPRAPELHAHVDRYHIREDLEMRVSGDQGVTLASNAPDADTAIGDWKAVGALGEGVSIALGAAADRRGKLEELGWARLSPDAFGALRVAHRFPLDGVDVDQRNLPQELHRDARLISFTKGCYLGQETVARIDALGRVNRVLVRIEAEGPPLTAGDELRADGKVIGWVTTVCPSSDAGRQRGLAYVRREHSSDGTAVSGPQEEQRVLVVNGG